MKTAGYRALVMFLVLAGVWLSACVTGAGEQSLNAGNSSGQPASPTALNPSATQTPAASEPPAQQGQNYNPSTKGRSALPAKTFSMLPAMPGDFSEKAGLMQDDSISIEEFASLGEAYWKQPEAYPNSDYAFSQMLNPPAGRWGAQGYGAFPSVASVEAKPGSSFQRIFFFKTSWLVESFQGVSLYHEVKSLDGQGGNGSAQAQPELAQKISVDYSPKEFLLQPAYPDFWAGWVEKVTVNTTLGDLPEGEYTISFQSQRPSQSSDWAKSYYPYFDAAFSLSRPFFEIRLTVKR